MSFRISVHGIAVRMLITVSVLGALWISTIQKAYSWSPYSWATYYAQRRQGPITIDGDLSDWQGVRGFTMDQPKFFFVGQGMSSAKWKGPQDLSATFKI